MPFKCLCGAVYTLMPDEDAEDMPPSWSAKLFKCPVCNSLDWLEPYDLGLDEWPLDEEIKN